MISGAPEFRRTRAGLVAAAFLGPFSATQLAGSLTVGRAAVLAFGALLTADLLRERPRHFRLDTPALLLAAAYLGFSAWILVNSVAWGCSCDGRTGGFFEFAAIGLLAVAALSIEPRLREPAIVATLVGLVLASSLALAGVGSINSGTVDLTQTGGRLSGTFGNANELGLAAALGLPIALAYRAIRGRPAGRIAIGASVLILAITLVLTYSRGAIIAAGAGVLAMGLWRARGSRRRLAIILAGAAVLTLVGAVLYSVFERKREDASFESVPRGFETLDPRDVSGWDSRPLGQIPRGPAPLLNEGSAIAVRATRAGEGASFRWGEAQPGNAYTLFFRAKAGSPDEIPFSYALADGAQRVGGRRSDGVLDRSWHRFSLVWRPRRRSPHATLYLWQRAGPSTFAVEDVQVVEGAPGRGPAQVIAIPSRLRGSIYDHLTSIASRSERRYVRSRVDAANLALDAFRSEPLIGIGWATFPDYSAVHLHYGRLAAHDQYLSIAAELGIVGLLLLALMIAAAVAGIKRIGPGRPGDAAVGVLGATAAGLVFVEALPTPQLSVPIAIAFAIVCGGLRGGPGRDQSASTRSRTSAPSPIDASEEK